MFEVVLIIGLLGAGLSQFLPEGKESKGEQSPAKGRKRSDCGGSAARYAGNLSGATRRLNSAVVIALPNR